MIIEQATVIAYQNGIAIVSAQKKGGCGSCTSAQACGTQSLSALLGGKQAVQFELPVSEPLKQGDLIELGVTERSLLVSVVWLYLLPLATLIMSALVFSQYIQNELIVVLAILACTALAFIAVKKWLVPSQEKCLPIFLRKI